MGPSLAGPDQPPTPTETLAIYSLRQVSHLVGESRDTIKAILRERRIAHGVVGRTWVIDAAALRQVRTAVEEHRRLAACGWPDGRSEREVDPSGR